MIETAGILMGAIAMVTVSSPDAPSPPAPFALGSFALVNVTFTGRQCLPACVSGVTFDQMTELPVNERLVASSNS